MASRASCCSIPIMPNPRYRAIDHYAVLDGNATLADNEIGRYFVCISKDKVGRSIRDSDLVHLEQRRGDLVRTIVRKAEVRGTRMRFVSLTPGNKPVALKDVVVKGLVVGCVVTYRV